ncbi:MAG: transglutaminase domain-containing protein, partial [bacterium]
MRIFFILILLLIGFSVNYAFADDDPLNIDSIKDSIPSIWLEAFNENIEVMGENRTEFEKAFSSLDSKEKKRAAVFLVAYMPLVDLVAMDAQTMIDNIDYAFKAREEFPWAGEYDETIFFHYVLPHRVSQEPIENFRPFFYNELKDRLKGLTTLDEAAVEVNKWCDEKVDFKQTQRRDQGPFETLKSGYGRCEEMMIFYIDAARSVGIPARQAWTPYWAHCDNNHAWSEVWARGKWNFLGACEYAPSLDQAWFVNPAKRAALVMSVPFGLPDKETTVEEIYRYADYLPDRYAIINSTSFYTVPGSLEVTVVDKNDEPMKEANVLVYVFNFGALRPIAKLVTDENGVAQITIGEGRFFVSGGDENSGGGMIVNVKK